MAAFFLIHVALDRLVENLGCNSIDNKRNRSYRTNGAYRTYKMINVGGVRREERSLTSFQDDKSNRIRMTMVMCFG